MTLKFDSLIRLENLSLTEITPKFLRCRPVTMVKAAVRLIPWNLDHSILGGKEFEPPAYWVQSRSRFYKRNPGPPCSCFSSI